MITVLEHHLLRAYLDRELAAPEEEAFELLVLDRPDLAELVGADAALTAGLTQGVDRKQKVVRTRPTRTRRPLAAAFAAGLAMASFSGWWWLRHLPSLAPASVVFVDAVRGADTRTNIVLPQSGVLVAMLPALHGGCQPEVEVEQGRNVWKAQANQDRSGYASVVVEHGVLQPGAATFRIHCAGKPTASYEVDVAR